MSTKPIQPIWITLAFLFTSVSLPADDIAAQGRKILERHKHAVVTVRMVQTSMFSMPGMAGDSSESRADATGTMIGPDGLTVLSLATTDPDSLMQSILTGLGSAEDGLNFSMKTELSDLRILLHDNTELPAEVVLRDKVQDLIFIRPKEKPGRDLPHVDLHQNGSAEILEQYITLNRLGKVAGRTYSASTGRIAAVSERRTWRRSSSSNSAMRSTSSNRGRSTRRSSGGNSMTGGRSIPWSLTSFGSATGPPRSSDRAVRGCS